MVKIGIIGGGLSGVSASVKLNEHLQNIKEKDANFQITIFEAKSEIGGRIGCIRYNSNGDLIDNGQHVAIGAYNNFFELLRIIGSFELLTSQETLDIDYLVNKKYYKLKSSNNRLLKVLDLDLLVGLINFKLLNFKDKINIIKFALNLKFLSNKLYKIIENSEKLQNVEALLGEYKQTKNSIKYFWEPLCIATLNTNINEASSTVFLNVLIQGFFAGSEKSKLYYSKSSLAELIFPINNKQLFPNINVLSSTIITKVEINENQTIVLSDNLNKSYEFDYVMNATNYDVFSRLFNQYLDDYFKSEYLNFKSSPILSIYLWFEIDFFEQTIIATPESPIQWIFNRNSMEEKIGDLVNGITSKGYYCITISAADKIKITNNNNIETLNLIEKSNNEILEFVLNELSKLIPEKFSKEQNNTINFRSKLLNYKIIKENKATFRCTEYIHNNRPEIEDINFNNELFNKKIVVTGDWLSNDFPSTIEGAVLNGFRAAKILYDKILR